jgi:hypothetical protein
MIDLITNKVCNINFPANDIEIAKIETEMKVKLPKAYMELLKYSNGFSTNNGLLIYGTHDIIERNLTWEIKEYAKGYIAVGDDGRGKVFLMKQAFNSTDLYIVDSGYMNPIEASLVTPDFLKWINGGCVINDSPNNADPICETCSIILMTLPAGGSKDLLTIKNTFGLELTANELLKGSKKLPFVLVSNFPYGKAKKMVEKLGDLGDSLKIIPLFKSQGKVLTHPFKKIV